MITPGTPSASSTAHHHFTSPSTLLMLVAAFAGYDTTMAAYRHAVATGYRFYSYGDAMCVTGGN